MTLLHLRTTGNRSRPALARKFAIGLIAFTAVLAAAPPAQASPQFKTWRELGDRQCMGVAGGNMTNGTPIITWGCNGNPDQLWQVDMSVNGWQTFRNYKDQSKCLGVAGGSSAVNAALVIWTCDGTPSQLFRIAPTPSQPEPAPYTPLAGCLNNYVITEWNGGALVMRPLGWLDQTQWWA